MTALQMWTCTVFEWVAAAVQTLAALREARAHSMVVDTSFGGGSVSSGHFP